MSAADALRVARVLAVVGGIVREAYQPAEWMPSPVEGLRTLDIGQKIMQGRGGA